MIDETIQSENQDRTGRGARFRTVLIFIVACLTLFNTAWILYTMSHSRPTLTTDASPPTMQAPMTQTPAVVTPAVKAQPTAAEVTQSGCLELHKAMDACAQANGGSTRTDSCVSARTKAANVDTTYCNEDGTVRDVPYHDAVVTSNGVTPASSYSTAATPESFKAIISCGTSGFTNLNVLACFAGNPSTELELTNGGQYGLAKSYQLSSLGRTTSEGLEITLQKPFALKVQNSSPSLILGVRIVSNKTGEQIFGKQVAQFGVINIGNQ